MAFQERIKMLAKIKRKNQTKDNRMEVPKQQEPEEPPCGFLCREDLKWWGLRRGLLPPLRAFFSAQSPALCGTHMLG